MNYNSVSSRVEKEKVFLEDDKNVREHRHKHSRAEKEAGYFDTNMPSSKNPLNDWARRDEQDVNMYRSKSVSVNSSRETKFVDYSPRVADFGRSLRLKGVKDTPGLDNVAVGGFYKRSLRTIDEQNRFSASHYPDQGPSASSYSYGSIYGYHKPGKSFEYLNVPKRVQNLEKDRAQLLKKLEELKDQLSISHDMPQRCRERVPSDNKMAFRAPLGWSTGNKSTTHHRSAQSHLVSELTYSNHSSINDDDHVQNLYGDFHPALKHDGYQMPCYGDSLSPGIQRRPHHRDQGSLQDPQQRTYGYSSWQYMDFVNENTLASYLKPDETLDHRPACSCSHCYDKYWKGCMPMPPTGFINRRFLKDPCNSTFNHYLNSDGVGQRYLPRAAECPQLNFQDPAAHVWPTDIDSDIDSFARRCPRRRVLNCRNKQLSQPIAGGAPFITCYNCLELLQLPRKLKEVIKNDHRLRCGACSTVVVFEMEKKGLTISVPKSSKLRSTEAKVKSSELNENHKSSTVCFNANGTICTSSNVENSGYDQTSPMENQSPDSVTHWKDSPGSSKRPFSNDVSPKVPSFPLQEQVKNPSYYEAVSGHRKGNRTNLEQQEKVIPMKNASQMVSEKNAPVAAEVEVPFSGYLNTPSQNSLEASTEENQLKLHKGSKSFLVGLIKKSFGDFTNVKNERPTVLVNGQPISDSAVKSAEKQAGPIQPGSYWYDSQAGFWGVIGQPCSGIIPPFIDEFNYRMSENCAAGNTGVFINGRELHQKDLDMLACKGLPTTRDKRYKIEVSGRVLDQGTGKQLYSLGKLAPTVEKEKRGFGMQVPCVVKPPCCSY